MIAAIEFGLRAKPGSAKARVLAEIEADNALDIEGPFVPTGRDPRMLRVALSSRDIAPEEALKSKKFDFNDAEFWFLKGYGHAHGGSDEQESAIDSYRQAIRKDPSHVQSMHNLACVYEAQRRFNLAIKWFTFAKGITQTTTELKPGGPALRPLRHLIDYLNAYYGIALSNFKSGNPGRAVPALDEAIKQLDDRRKASMEEQRQKSLPFKKKPWYAFYYFRYLRALCHRVLGNFSGSERDYTGITDAFRVQEGKQICRNIFAMIIIPFEENRSRILQLVDSFHATVDDYEVDRDRRVLWQHYQEGQEPRWRENKRLHVQNALMNLSFFKRFSPRRVREMMDRMTLRLVPAGRILFFEKTQVYVIISGSMLMQNHKLRTDLPVTHAKFRNGAIMNFLQDGSEIFNSLETWFLAQVETEIAVFEKEYFRRVWDEDVMTEELMLKRSLVKCYEVFKNFSDLALMTLVSELMQIKTFKKDDLVMHQSKVAPSSTAHQEFIRSHE